MTKNVRFQDNPVTLIGNSKNVNDNFPTGITLLATDLSPVKIEDTTGVKIVTTVPSLDTPVCDAQVRKFNEKGAELGVNIFAVSADLPFAQARWCGAAGIKNLKTLSDHRSMALADALGLHIKELRLFARSVMVVDANGKIIYMQIVPEVTDEPDYDSAIAALKKVL